jgi:hypothetical protein
MAEESPVREKWPPGNEKMRDPKSIPMTIEIDWANEWARLGELNGNRRVRAK